MHDLVIMNGAGEVIAVFDADEVSVERDEHDDRLIVCSLEEDEEGDVEVVGEFGYDAQWAVVASDEDEEDEEAAE